MAPEASDLSVYKLLVTILVHSIFSSICLSFPSVDLKCLGWLGLHEIIGVFKHLLRLFYINNREQLLRILDISICLQEITMHIAILSAIGQLSINIVLLILSVKYFTNVT